MVANPNNVKAISPHSPDETHIASENDSRSIAGPVTKYPRIAEALKADSTPVDTVELSPNTVAYVAMYSDTMYHPNACRKITTIYSACGQP